MKETGLPTSFELAWRSSLIAMASLTTLLLGGCVVPGGVRCLVRDPAAAPALVAVQGGVLEGVAAPGGRAWLGVRYAAPPTGPLRWRAPRPPAPWMGLRQSLRLGGDCVQNLSPRAILGKPGGLFVRGSEDCLFLNIYAPSSEAGGDGWPVMVWLHGGGFVAGTAGNYDPSRLAQAQGVIVVTLNYRLGAFGFLAHAALTAEDAASGSGDYALLDQQAALRWVQANIAGFGGDPRRVTLFGESAGGFSVCEQLAAPGAVGLFAGAIIESGACTAPAENEPLAEAQAAGALMAVDLGCDDPAAVLACLRRASARRIARTVSHRPGALGRNGWGAVVGGPVLPQSAAAAFAEGRFQHVPVILGTNHDEGRLFAYLQRLNGRLGTAASYQAVLHDTYGDAAGAVQAHYPVAAYGSPALAYAALITDDAFACPAETTARLLSARTPTWVYRFDDPDAVTVLPPLPTFPRLGAYHASEIAYVFQRPWILADPARFDPAQRRLSDEMQAAWGRFARAGDPGGSWPRYPLTHRFAPAASVTEDGGGAEHNCAFWRRVEER